MKQHITTDELLQLTPEQQNKLCVLDENGVLQWSCISIGQCIELLDNVNEFKGFHKSNTDGRYKVYGENEQHQMRIYDSSELIDALWEAVKSIL